MQGAGAPLFETLGASFPAGLFPDGVEQTVKHRVRRRLRDIGYRVVFPPDEPWESVIELFAIAGLERMHRGYGENPWFWVVAWPGVFGAAAVDFWPEQGEASQRRMIAAEAAHQHLEAILIRAALNDSGRGALPAAAIAGLRAIGQGSLPALPNAGAEGKAAPLAGLTSKSAPGFSAVPLYALSGQQEQAFHQQPPAAADPEPDEPPSGWMPPPVGGQAAPPAAAAATACGAVGAPRPPQPAEAVASPPTGAAAGAAAAGGGAARRACPECRGAMVLMQAAGDAYEQNRCVVCDVCHELCGDDAPNSAVRPEPFLHCAACRLDICEQCAGT